MRMISKVVGVSVGTVDSILTEDLKLHKICAKDPLKGSETVLQFCVERCTDMLKMIETNSSL